MSSLAPEIVILRGADVYSPDRIGRPDVVVAGGRIAAVGSVPPIPPGWPVEELDLSGMILAPGLVDVHAHLAGGGGEGGAETRVPALGLTQLTMHGVTTAIGLLGTDGTTRTIADLLAVARGLDNLGITALCYTGSYQLPPVTLTGSIRGDIVHVDRIVAVGELALSDHRSSQPTLDELLRVASDAHVAGMMTGKAGLLHLHLGDGPRGLALIRRALEEAELPARTFHPTHCNRNPALWEEAMVMGERGCTIDVTAFPDDDSAAASVAQWIDAKLDSRRITVSSDGGGCLPEFDAEGMLLGMGVGTSRTLLDTVRSLRSRGVPLATALATVTSNPARLYRLRGKGRLAPGADADLVVLDADLRVRATMARGRFLVRDGAPVVKGPFE